MKIRKLQEGPLGQAQKSGGVTQIQEKPGIGSQLQNKAVNAGIDKAQSSLIDPFASEFAGGLSQGFGNAQAASALGVDSAAGIGLEAFGGAGAAQAGTGALGAGSAIGGARRWCRTRCCR